MCTTIYSLDDEAFMCTTNVTNDDYSHEYASQEYETSQYGDDNLDMDDEGFILKGRTANYTTKEDVLICTAWNNVSQDANVGTDQSAVTYWQRSKEFTLAAIIAQVTPFANVGAPSTPNVKSGRVAWQMLIA